MTERVQHQPGYGWRMADVWLTYGNAGAALGDRAAAEWDGEGEMSRTDDHTEQAMQAWEGWERAKTVGAFLTCLILFGLVPLFAYGLEFTLLSWAIFVLIPLAGLFGWAFLHRFAFKKISPRASCVYPRDDRRDLWRRYGELFLQVTIIWMTFVGIFLTCIYTMKLGMGDQWNPFTRTIRLTKSGPFSEYGLHELAMFVSGFFALTGLVWWPMIVFFEWLTTRGRVHKMRGMAHA
jgi:hypothetical protein